MKALSIKQPWADFIAQGFKPYEIRRWQTSYRGDLLICASQTVHRLFRVDKKRKEGEKIFTYDPAEPDFNGFLFYGKALFVATLSDIEPFQQKHVEKAMITYMPDHFAWHLTNIRQIEPFDFKGKLNFFEVDDNLIKLI